MSNIKLFESKKIRSLWNEEDKKWYFSVADVVGALSDSADPKAYWRQLKHREPELVTNCHGLMAFRLVPLNTNYNSPEFEGIKNQA